MRTIMIFLFCVLVSVFAFTADENQEPTREYTLVINKQEHKVSLNDSVQIKGKFDNPIILLKASPIRRFAYGGIEFLYPANFTWEADLGDASCRRWTLSGNDYVIMYFVFSEVIKIEDFIAGVASVSQRKDLNGKHFEAEFGGKKHKGKVFLINNMGASFKWEVFMLPSKNGSRMLVLQDTTEGVDSCSKEGKDAFALFTKSFAYKADNPKAIESK